jgi:hypothetical protein
LKPTWKISRLGQRRPTLITLKPFVIEEQKQKVKKSGISNFARPSIQSNNNNNGSNSSSSSGFSGKECGFFGQAIVKYTIYENEKRLQIDTEQEVEKFVCRENEKCGDRTGGSPVRVRVREILSV